MPAPPRPVIPPPDLWSARFPLWDAYFGLVALGTGFAVALGDRPVVPARAAALALLAALAAWYLAFGRRLMVDQIEDWRGYAYLLGVFALYMPAVMLAGTTSFALFALCAQAFMVLGTLPAIGAVLLLNAVHVVVLVIRAERVSDVAGPIMIAALVAIVAAIFGTWARYMVSQSEERAALIRELNNSRTEVARLSHQAGIAAERQRLAGEIHDTIAQGLSSVVMLIQAASADLDRDVGLARRHLGLAVDTARENLAETRALVAALTPSELTGSPLVQALGRLVDRFGAESGLTASFRAIGPERPLATSVEVVLLRAAQESLTNARKHAEAASVSVRLEHHADHVVLEVTDDGCGFAVAPTTVGYGLSAMRARVEQVSGVLTVDSDPGRGTTVRVEVASS